MSSLHETFAAPKLGNKKAGLVALGVSSLAVSAMLFGPGVVRAHHDAQAIEHKREPAKAYVAKTLGELVLNGQRLNLHVGDHECSRGPKYTPGDVSRYCKIQGESTYYTDAKDFSTAYDQASSLLHQHKIERGRHTISYEGQTIDVAVDFTVKGAQSYNSSYERTDTPRKVPDGSYVVEYDVAAYTVNFTAPDYPYNDDP